MNIHEMIETILEQIEADGLVCPENACSCGGDTLFAAESCDLSLCFPALKRRCVNCKIEDCCDIREPDGYCFCRMGDARDRFLELIQCPE